MLKCLILNDRDDIPRSAILDIQEYANIIVYETIGLKLDLKQTFSEHYDTDILISSYASLNRENLSLLKQLRVIILTTIATDYIDIEYCENEKITIHNTPDYVGYSVAEHALALFLAIHRNLFIMNSRVKSGDIVCSDLISSEAKTLRVGIIGVGNIGGRLVNLCSCLGMSVSYFSRHIRTIENAKYLPLDILLSNSDVIFVCVPLNFDSHNLLSRKKISLMKNNSILVSTSPEDVIDLLALADALKSNKIHGCGLDILNSPLNLISDPNCIITPRRAWYTQQALDRRIASWKNTLLLELNLRK